MSEFADECERQRSELTPQASKQEDASFTNKRSTQKPNDSALTTWLANYHPAPTSQMQPAAADASRSEAQSEATAQRVAPNGVAVPPAFNIPIPAQACSAVPKALNWTSAAPLMTCPSEELHGEPLYKAPYDSDGYEMYKGAFSSSWSEARLSYNALVTLHRAFKDKEKDIIPLLQVDATRPLGAGIQGIDASKSFEGGKLKPSLSNIDSTKLTPDLRAQIFKARDKIKVTEFDVANKRDLITNANENLRIAANNIQIAANKLQVAKIDTQVENLQLDKEQIKRDVEDFKAKVKATVESVKFVTSIINCWSDPSKLFGNVVGAVNQGATAGGAIAEAAYTVDANSKLAGLDGQIRGLKNQKGSLLSASANAELDTAFAEMDKKINEGHIAIRTMEAARLANHDAHREMSTLIEKAGAASGLNPKDRKAVAGAVEAMPKIETILEQLQGMEIGLEPPPYSEASGVGAAMASNASVFTHAVSIVKGNRSYVAELRALWEARRASVLAVVDKSVSVTGDE